MQIVTLTPLYSMGIVPTRAYPKYRRNPNSKTYAMCIRGTYTNLPYNFVLRTYGTSYKGLQAKRGYNPMYIPVQGNLTRHNLAQYL